MCVGLLLIGMAGCGSGANSYQLPEAPPPQQPPPVPQQSGSVTIMPQYAALAPGQTTRFAAQVSGAGTVEWLVNNIAGGNASAGIIDHNGNYTAPQVSLGTNAVISAALPASPQTNYATAVVAVIHSGQLTPTANTQVVAYSIYLPGPGNVSVQFGTGNLVTSSQPTPSPNGGMVHVYVAGMYATTTYHMHAAVTLANGVSFSDADQVFTTGTAPGTSGVQVTSTGGDTPQSGVELFDTVIPHTPAQLFATDLQGNVVWTYQYRGSSMDAVQGAKLLPNGHFLVLISFLSSLPPKAFSNLPSDTIDLVREVDLAGNTIRELNVDQLTQSLHAQGYNFTLQGFHHDVLPSPNGHILLLADMRVPYTNLPGYAGTTSVLGDLLVDVDQNFTPTWVWNAFDHLDVTRHPYNFPDWTHGNALLYSADDHNLLFSMRHQNWIIKIDYQDGKGAGDILWRLGSGGDFKLLGGTDPTDWFYAQHGPSFFTPNTTGVFQLGVMDNGDDRQFPSGIVCNSAGAPPCLYSTAPVLQIDETAMTATLLSNYTPPVNLYSYFGGNVDPLANGDMEVDFCAPKSGAVVQELKPSGAWPQFVWQATTPGASQFRAMRLPSLYPGVQW
ncbi:MAG: aryl-sulfate sulfotransferase [Candidatus Sulfotelmatobacter sp.]